MQAVLSLQTGAVRAPRLGRVQRRVKAEAAENGAAATATLEKKVCFQGRRSCRGRALAPRWGWPVVGGATIAPLMAAFRAHGSCRGPPCPRLMGDRSATLLQTLRPLGGTPLPLALTTPGPVTLPAAGAQAVSPGARWHAEGRGGGRQGCQREVQDHGRGRQRHQRPCAAGGLSSAGHRNGRARKH